MKHTIIAVLLFLTVGCVTITAWEAPIDTSGRFIFMGFYSSKEAAAMAVTAGATEPLIYVGHPEVMFLQWNIFYCRTTIHCDPITGYCTTIMCSVATPPPPTTVTINWTEFLPRAELNDPRCTYAVGRPTITSARDCAAMYYDYYRTIYANVGMFTSSQKSVILYYF